MFSIYLEWHSALAPNRKYPIADTWKLIILPLLNFSLLFRFLFYSTVLSEVAFHLILRRTNNIWVHLELTCSQSTTYLFSIYLERHSALAPNRKYPIADTWKLITLKPSQFFSLFRFLFYSTVLSEVAFRLILRRTNNIWVDLETEYTTYLFSSYLEWHSASAPNRKYPIADTWKLIILTPKFFHYWFLFYSTVLSEVAFRLILRRTNNIWVHLETESTTYLFSIYLEWHSASAPNRKYPIADTWKLIILPLVKCFHYSDSYFTLLSSLRWHSALSSEGQIIFGYIWRQSPQLTCSQSIWSGIPP